MHLCCLEDHVLEKVSGAVISLGLVATARVDPDPNGRCLALEVLGRHTHPIAQGGHFGERRAVSR